MSTAMTHSGSRSPSSGGHEHDERYQPRRGVTPLVEESQEISDLLQPVINQLNQALDRLEELAGLEEEEQRPP